MGERGETTRWERERVWKEERVGGVKDKVWRLSGNLQGREGGRVGVHFVGTCDIPFLRVVLVFQGVLWGHRDPGHRDDPEREEQEGERGWKVQKRG